MSSFTKPLILEYGLRGDEPVYKLVETFEYYTFEVMYSHQGDMFYPFTDPFFRRNTYSTPFIITVPKGFVTNFASIPKIFHSILTPDGVHGKAAVIHDKLYGDIKRDFKDNLLQCTSWTDMVIAQEFMEQSKLLSDKIFVEAMDVLKVKPWKKSIMFTMLRLFGFSAILTGGK